jgi:hypothetical protein
VIWKSCNFQATRFSIGWNIRMISYRPEKKSICEAYTQTS